MSVSVVALLFRRISPSMVEPLTKNSLEWRQHFNPQTGHNASDFPVALADIDHIEVLEGAASRLFGTSAFTGTINIVTKKAKNDGVSASVEGGSFGSFGAQGRIQTALKRGQVDSGLFRKRRLQALGWRHGEQRLREGTGLRQLLVLLRPAFRHHRPVGIASQSYMLILSTAPNTTTNMRRQSTSAWLRSTCVCTTRRRPGDCASNLL